MAWFSHQVGTALVGSFMQAQYGPSAVDFKLAYNGTAGSVVILVKTH